MPREANAMNLEELSGFCDLGSYPNQHKCFSWKQTGGRPRSWFSAAIRPFMFKHSTEFKKRGTAHVLLRLLELKLTLCSSTSPYLNTDLHIFWTGAKNTDAGTQGDTARLISTYYFSKYRILDPKKYQRQESDLEDSQWITRGSGNIGTIFKVNRKRDKNQS